MIRALPIYLLLALTLLCAGCEDERVQREYPRVRTLPVTNITEEGAVFSAEVYEAGNVEISEHGFAFGLIAAHPEYGNNISMGELGSSVTFSFNVTSSLIKGEKYYVAAFVKSGEYTVYGNILEFVSQGSHGPEITGFSPERVICGDTIIVRGEYFSPTGSDNHVMIGNVAARVCEPVSDSLLYVVVPFNVSGTENLISVEITGQSTTYTQKALVIDLPQIESVTPSQARWGDTISMSFRNLRKSDDIRFLMGEIPMIITEDYDGSTTRGIVPFEAGLPLMDLSVSTSDTRFTFPGRFTILPPVIRSVYPEVSSWSDTITLYGVFNINQTGSRVLFDEIPGKIVSVSRDSVRVIVPDELPGTPAVLTYKFGSFTSNSDLLISFSPPVIATVSPMSDYAGGIVTITGKYFKNNYTTIRFNDIVATIISVTDTKIQYYAPGYYCGPSEISVTVGGKTAVFGQKFDLTNPSVVSFYPTHASPGDTITVDGQNLQNANSFRFGIKYGDQVIGGLYLQTVSQEQGQARVIVPSGDYISGMITAWAWRNSVESYLSGDERLRIDAPLINLFSPSSGSVGTVVTLSGEHFSLVPEHNKVTVRGVQAEIISCTRNEIRFRMPNISRGNFHISVSVCGYQVNSTGTFEYDSPWRILPDLLFTNNSFTMDFGDEVFVAAPVASSNVTLYKYVPGNYSFVAAGELHPSLYFFERPVVKGDRAYMTGYTYSTVKFLEFNRNTMSLSVVSDPPGKVSTHTILMDGDSVLYAGGGDSLTCSGYFVKEFWKYNLSSGAWKRLNDLPFYCMASSSFTINGRNFVISIDRKLWEYKPVTDTWSHISTYPGTGNSEMMIVVCNGKVYIGHGRYGDNQIYSYNPQANSWDELLNELPQYRTNPVDFEYGGKIYFGGSLNNDFWEYDPLLEQ
jgi:hypothetical protein